MGVPSSLATLDMWSHGTLLVWHAVKGCIIAPSGYICQVQNMVMWTSDEVPVYNSVQTTHTTHTTFTYKFTTFSYATKD